MFIPVFCWLLLLCETFFWPLRKILLLFVECLSPLMGFCHYRAVRLQSIWMKHYPGLSASGNLPAVDYNSTRGPWLHLLEYPDKEQHGVRCGWYTMITPGMEMVMMQDLNLPILKRGQTWLSEFPFQRSDYSFTAWKDGSWKHGGQGSYWIKGREEQGGMGGMDTNEYDNDR